MTWHDTDTVPSPPLPCLQVVALTFCSARDAYVKSVWNLLDLAIVCVSFLVLLAEIFPALKPLKTLRILRVLRPLRLVSRNPYAARSPPHMVAPPMPHSSPLSAIPAIVACSPRHAVGHAAADRRAVRSCAAA
jgi:hypothetical protein